MENPRSERIGGFLFPVLFCDLLSHAVWACAPQACSMNDVGVMPLSAMLKKGVT